MESSPYRRATRGRPSALRPASRSSSLIAPFRSVKKRTDAGSRGRPTVAPVVCTVRANVLQVRASSGSLRTLSWMIRATASRSSGRVGAATSRPAIRRTSPPAVSQAHLLYSLATPEPTAPRTAVMAAIDMGSSMRCAPCPAGSPGAPLPGTATTGREDQRYPLDLRADGLPGERGGRPVPSGHGPGCWGGNVRNTPKEYA